MIFEVFVPIFEFLWQFLLPLLLIVLFFLFLLAVPPGIVFAIGFRLWRPKGSERNLRTSLLLAPLFFLPCFFSWSLVSVLGIPQIYRAATFMGPAIFILVGIVALAALVVGYSAVWVILARRRSRAMPSRRKGFPASPV